MIAVIDGAGEPASKTRQLQAIVDSAVDVNGIAQFCLGRYWQTASEPQRQAFLAQFHGVLLDGITAQISAYRGVKVDVGRSQPEAGGTLVSSTVIRPQLGPARADWLVAQTASGLKIEDLVAEGTSMRLTRRNDYSAFLSSHGGDVGALLAAMRQRAAKS